MPRSMPSTGRALNAAPDLVVVVSTDRSTRVIGTLRRMTKDAPGASSVTQRRPSWSAGGGEGRDVSEENRIITITGGEFKNCQRRRREHQSDDQSTLVGERATDELRAELRRPPRRADRARRRQGPPGWRTGSTRSTRSLRSRSRIRRLSAVGWKSVAAVDHRGRRRGREPDEDRGAGAFAVRLMSSVRGAAGAGRGARRPAGVGRPREADEATRALCAAVHRSRTAPPRRSSGHSWSRRSAAVPPSPGLDAAAVLGDAVAAYTRRRLRDARRAGLARDARGARPGRGRGVGGLAALLVRFEFGADARHRARAAGVPGAVAAGRLAGRGAGAHWRRPSSQADAWWPTLAVAVLLWAVLTADHYVGMHFLRRRFQPGCFVADRHEATSAVERWLRGLGIRRFADQLERVAAADEYDPAGAELVDVDRPPHGDPLRRRRLPAASHQPVTCWRRPGKRVEPIDVADLHRHLVAALDRPIPRRRPATSPTACTTATRW